MIHRNAPKDVPTVVHQAVDAFGRSAHPAGSEGHKTRRRRAPAASGKLGRHHRLRGEQQTPLLDLRELRALAMMLRRRVVAQRPGSLRRVGPIGGNSQQTQQAGLSRFPRAGANGAASPPRGQRHLGASVPPAVPARNPGLAAVSKNRRVSAPGGNRQDRADLIPSLLRRRCGPGLAAEPTERVA